MSVHKKAAGKEVVSEVGCDTVASCFLVKASAAPWPKGECTLGGNNEVG